MGVVIGAAKKAGRPISRQEALEAVRQAGLTIEVARPVEVLATMLWRAANEGKVAMLKDGYWPADSKPPKR